ncbi:MAG: hypothetical protein SFX18_09275 [Pirellulales bacterium]|nr:hypothetical protein [Pirellulales bacterium]
MKPALSPPQSVTAKSAATALAASALGVSPRSETPPKFLRRELWGLICCAGLLVAGGGTLVYETYAPWDRAQRFASQIPGFSSGEYPRALRELLDSGAAGRHYALNFLGHQELPLRQAARNTWEETLLTWQREHLALPADFASLLAELPNHLSKIPPGERSDWNAHVDLWLAVSRLPASAQTVTESRYLAEKWLLNWRTETATLLANHPPVSQPETDIAEPQLLLEESSLKSTQSIGELLPNDGTGEFADTGMNERKAQFSKNGDAGSGTAQAPSPLPAFAANAPLVLGNPINNDAGIALTHDQNSSDQDSGLAEAATSPALPETTSPPDRTAIAEPGLLTAATGGQNDIPPPPRTIADVAPLLRLVSAIERWRETTQGDRATLGNAYQVQGWLPAEIALWELYCCGKPSEVIAKVQNLPSQTEIDPALWLRVFSQHPSPEVRKASYSWLCTAPDAVTRQWLRERQASEGDENVRRWLENSLQAADPRASGAVRR